MAQSSYRHTDPETGEEIVVVGPSPPTGEQWAKLHAEYRDRVKPEEQARPPLAQVYVPPPQEEERYSESPEVGARREAREHWARVTAPKPSIPQWLRGDDTNKFLAEAPPLNAADAQQRWEAENLPPKLATDYMEDWRREGPERVVRGVKDFLAPAEGSGLTPSEVRTKRAGAGSDILRGGVIASAPLGIPLAAGTAPLVMAAGVGRGAALGYAGLKAGGAIGEIAGLDPAQIGLLEDIGAFGLGGSQFRLIPKWTKRISQGEGMARKIPRHTVESIFSSGPTQRGKPRGLGEFENAVASVRDTGPQGLQARVSLLRDRGRHDEAEGLLRKTKDLIDKGRPVQTGEQALRDDLISTGIGFQPTLNKSLARMHAIEDQLVITGNEVRFNRMGRGIDRWRSARESLQKLAEAYRGAGSAGEVDEAEIVRLLAILNKNTASGAELITVKRALDRMRSFMKKGDIEPPTSSAYELKQSADAIRAQLKTNPDLEKQLNQQQTALEVVSRMADVLSGGGRSPDLAGLSALALGSMTTGMAQGVAASQFGRQFAFTQALRMKVGELLYRGIGGPRSPIHVSSRPETPLSPPASRRGAGESTSPPPPPGGRGPGDAARRPQETLAARRPQETLAARRPQETLEAERSRRNRLREREGLERRATESRKAREAESRRVGEAESRKAREAESRRARESQRRDQTRGRTTTRDPYEVLGVPRTATAEQIRTAWRNLARENHPDRIVGTIRDTMTEAGQRATAERVAEATRRMAEINNAYHRLSQR